MSDSEIIRALECCMSKDTRMCKKCPCWKDNNCKTDLDYYILELIKRQQAEIAELNNLLKLSNDIINDFSEKIDEQKAEIADLKSDLIMKTNDYENTKELYENAIKIGQRTYDKLIEAYKKLQAAKSEAIKEFENKILELFPSDKDFTTISRFAVKQITKEMTEQRKEDEGK